MVALQIDEFGKVNVQVLLGQDFLVVPGAPEDLERVHAPAPVDKTVAREA